MKEIKKKQTVKQKLREATLTVVTLVEISPYIARDLYHKAKVYQWLLKQDYNRGSAYYGREYRARRALHSIGMYRACDITMDKYIKIRDKVIPHEFQRSGK